MGVYDERRVKIVATLGPASPVRNHPPSEPTCPQAALPDAELTRIAHRINGGHVCAYLVTPRARELGG